MSIIKSILSTFSFIIFTEIIGIWLLIDFLFDIRELANAYYPLINGIIEITLISLFLIKAQGRNSFSLSRTHLKYYIIAILIGFSQPLIVSILNSIYDLTNYITWADISKRYFINRLTINSISFVLLIPISEELFFRNYIQEGLQKNYNPFIAILVTSILFSLLHLKILNLVFNDGVLNTYLAFSTFFGGLMTGTIYYFSKSILPAIILHCIWNLLAH